MINYDPHRWRDTIFAIKGSVLQKVAPRVLLFSAWAGLLSWVNGEFYHLEMPAVAHTLVGVALGLLLVFRTNASYDRFWEGRRQWGSLINASRNLARGASALVRGEPNLSNAIRAWTTAFAYALMHRLRNGGGLGHAAQLVPNDEAHIAAESGNAPLACAARISLAIADARRSGALTDYEQMLMDTQVASLVDVGGACDRIHKTPLPFAYVIHLRTALILYCGSLPFALMRDFGGIGEVVVTTLVSFVLLGIEEIGVEIEDPFGTDANDLPLEGFCHTIERDMQRDLLGKKDEANFVNNPTSSR
ncbi:MAG: bestrophin family protein [Gemmataceae bacterium]